MSVFPMMCTAGGNSFAFPDVCLTPAPPAPPVPLPYPNIASCPDGDGSSKVKVTNSNALRKGDTIRLSSGDEAGCAPGGQASGQIKGPATIRTGCPKVKIEGKDAGYQTAMLAQNGSSANSPAGTNVAPCQMKVKVIGAPMSSSMTSEEMADGLSIVATPNAAAGQNAGEPDQLDQNCPSANHASESMDSLQNQANDPSNPNQAAAQSAANWMNNVPPQYQNGTLGADGGGGFLIGTCATTVIRAGTVVFRYFGGAATQMGAWWSAGPMNNPIADNALPPGNSATQMVRAVVKQDTTVLTGNGAPRCSNKPGGPPQLCFPRPPGGDWSQTFEVH